MKLDSIQGVVVRHPHTNGVELHLGGYDRLAKKAYSGVIEWKERDMNEVGGGNALTAHGVAAEDLTQSLMESLWATGVRPRNLGMLTPELIASKDSEIDMLKEILAQVMPSALRSPSK